MNERLNTNNNPENHGRDRNGECGPSSPERDLADAPRIYVVSLADYVNGNLHGRWIDAAQDVDDIWVEVKDMLAESRLPDAEEYAIHDYDGFHGLRLGEYESLQTVSAIAKGVAEHGEAFACWVDCIGTDGPTERPDLFTDCYQGHYESLEEYGSQMWDDFGYTKALEALPEALRSYVSVDAGMWARDMRLEGAIDYAHGSTGVHVFWA